MRFRLPIRRSLHYGMTNIPLWWMLVVPFVLQMVGVVALVGYLSYQSGQQAVTDLADRLINQTCDRTNDRLSTYLQTPHQIVQLNQLAIEQKSLNINNPNQLKQHFLQQIKSFPALTSIGWGDVQGNEIFVARDKAGIFAPSGSFLLLEHEITQRYHLYLIDDQGNRQKLLHSGPNYNTSQLPWYQAAVKAGKQVWTPIYPYAGVSTPGMNFSAPVDSPAKTLREQNGKFQGVLTSNVILSDLNLLLKSLHFSRSGQVFIIDRSGNLVATSTQEAPFVIANKMLVRLKASNSQDELTRLTAQYLLNQWHNLNQIQTPQHFYLPIRGKGLFAEVRPFRDGYGLDWLVVTTIPESDFMGKIQSNRNTTVLLCLLTLGLAIGSGTLMANWFTFRINRLNRLSHALAAGDLQQRLPADSPIAEVRGLAESINRMADQLQLSFVRLRNAKEESEEKFTTIFRASPDPIAISTLAEGRFLEINNQIIEFYGYSREEVIGRTSLELGLWANLEERQLFKQQLQDRGRVYNLEVTTPTKSGELKVVLLSAELCNLQGQDAVIIIIRDISDRKQTELALQASQAKLSEVLDSTIAGIVKLRFYPNISFQYDYISPHCERIYDFTAQELMSEPNLWQLRIHPDDWRDVFLPLFQNVLTQRGTATYSMEYRFRRKDESIGWILGNSWVQWNEAGQYWNVTVVDTDITDRKQTELALKQSQTSFLELSEASPAIIYIIVRQVDGSFYFEYISRVIETIHEISVEQILEDANILLDRIHPEDRAGYEAAAQHSLETLQPFRHEWRIITPSGKHKWLQGSSRPKLRDNGEIAWYGVAIDITEQQAALRERKLAEIALSQREEQLQTIAANIPGYLCRLVIHPDGTTLVPYLSPRAEQIYGLPVATLKADPTHWFSLIHPEDQPLLEAAIAAGAQTLKPLNLEFRAIGPDGQLKWINGTAQFYRTELGDTVMDGIGLDVTTRKQLEADREAAEIALKQSESRFRRIADSNIVGIILTTPTGEITEANDAFLLMVGYDRAQMLAGNLRWDRLTPPEYRQLDAAAVAHLLNYGWVQPFEKQYIRKDGSRVTVLVGGALVEGSTNQVICVILDISDRKQAENSLQQALQELTHHVENSPLATIRWNRELRVEKWSKQAEKIFGWKAEEVIGKTMYDWQLIFEDDVDDVNQAIAELIKGVNKICYNRNYHKDGSVLYCEWYNSVVFDEQGNLISTLSLVQDVTDRKQAEIALQESEERFREIANTIHQMFFVRSLNPDRFVYISPNYKTIFGPSLDELLKNPWAWIEAIHPDDRDQVQAFIASKMQKNQQSNFKVEYRIVRPDGTLRWIKAEISVIRDGEGNPLRFIGLVEDISERKQAEIALQESEARYRILCEVSPVAIFRFDRPLNCVYVNDRWSEITGRAKESALGKGWIDALHPDERENLLALWAKQLVHNTPINLIINQGEGRHLRPDGTINWYYVQVAREVDSAGKVVGYIGTLTDITDRKIAEQELSQAKAAAESANQAKSAFLANMSHELRTPLHAILGFAQLINRDTNLTPDYQKYIKIIHNSGNYLLKLINEILDLSKIEAGKLTLENQAIDLFDLLQSLHNTFSQRVSNQELQVNLEILPKVPQYIIADPQKLQQVLINLIGNAIKFTNRGSVILRVCLANQERFTTQDESSFFLHFQVQDTGIGIAQEDLQIIFDAFAQTPSGRQTQQGTGLGLTISRRLVKLMGGEITVSSSLGEGSTFKFTIPVQIAKETALQPQQPQRQVIGLAPNQPAYRILVVDDQAENRLLLVTLLAQVGLEVQEAASGEEALLLWQQWHPHLIFMDLRMPGLDGYETTKLIRAQEQKSQEVERPFPDYSTIIIALTAQTSIVDTPSLECPTGLYGTLHEPTQAKVAGFDDHISKPFPAETLLSKIAEHLGISYTYTEDSQKLPNDQTLVVDQNRMRENLALMPHDWIVELYQASRACQHKAVKQLIKQIPAEYPSLALGLEQLNQDFDFEKIMQLTAMYFDIHSD